MPAKHNIKTHKSSCKDEKSKNVMCNKIVMKFNIENLIHPISILSICKIRDIRSLRFNVKIIAVKL